MNIIEKVARIEDKEAFEFIIGEAGAAAQAQYWEARQNEAFRKAERAIEEIRTDMENNASPIFHVLIQDYFTEALRQRRAKA